MWIAITAVWVLGSIILYGTLIKTAKEANQEDCIGIESEFDSHTIIDKDAEDIRRAA